MFDSVDLQLLLDSLPDAVLVSDAEGRIRHCNRQCEPLFGYRRDEMLMQPIEILIPSRLRGHHERLRRDYLRRPRTRPIDAMQDIEALCKDGSRRPVSIALSPFPVAGDGMTIASVRDNSAAVEARRREREELEQRARAQRLENLGLLSCGIAHDLKNLVTVVLGNTELAQMAMGVDPLALSNHLQSVQAASQHLLELSRNMLSYATGGGGQHQVVDVNQSVNAMSRLLRASLLPTTLLRCELGTDLPSLRVDPVQISQVLLNLILNANDAIGRNGGCITVRTGSTGDHVYIEVEDNGCGIDDSVRNRILDPFFTTKAGGKGLGLSVVNGIVGQYGGSMDIRSRPGAGSMFCLRFPLTVNLPATTPAASA